MLDFTIDTYHHLGGALLLVITANVAPWASGMVLRKHFAWPIDFQARMNDGTRVLRDHKTWRSAVAGAAARGSVATLLGQAFLTGAVFGFVSLVASARFVKRRFRQAPTTKMPGLKQIPEALCRSSCCRDRSGSASLRRFS